MRSRAPAFLLPIIALAIAASSGAHAEASDARQRAAERFEEGRRAFARGDFTEAAERFEQAATIAPHPATLMNAAEAWERADETGRAAELCDRIAATPYADARFTDAATVMMLRIGRKIATLDVVAPRGGRVGIDGGPEVGIPHRFRLRPGRHQAMVIDATRRVNRLPIELAAGEARTLDQERAVQEASPAPTPPQSSAPPPELAAGAPPATASPAPWIFVGAAGVAVGIGGVFSFLTLESRDDYGKNPTHATADAFYRNRLIANIGLFGAGALAATGVVLLVLAPPHANVRGAQRARLELVPVAGGSALVGRLTF